MHFAYCSASAFRRGLPGNFAERFLSPSPELAELLRQFVTVELTDAQQIDLARIPFEACQDPDHTWWCWILSPQGQVYSVLGPQRPDQPTVFADDVRHWLIKEIERQQQ